MPGGLPPGLITNTETITEEIDKTERVQVEDVAKLWRGMLQFNLPSAQAANVLSVYSLNSSHMEDDEASRLENFFWRIWSNRNIITSIRGNTLARLFITISEGGNRVRTTPVPTPLATTPTQSAVSLLLNSQSACSLTQSDIFKRCCSTLRSDAGITREERATYCKYKHGR
jgi:Fungal protein of unknown function (DUF1752)